jgi:hypothetical protein
MMRRFTKTLAVALTGLCLTSTLALAQASRGGSGARDTRSGYATERAEATANAGWAASWDRVGSGGTNVGLQSGMNPSIRDTEQPAGTNHPGADRGEGHR